MFIGVNSVWNNDFVEGGSVVVWRARPHSAKREVVWGLPIERAVPPEFN